MIRKATVNYRRTFGKVERHEIICVGDGTRGDLGISFYYTTVKVLRPLGVSRVSYGPVTHAPVRLPFET